MFIFERGPFSRPPFFRRSRPQKVKYMDTSMPIDNDPVPMIRALYILSMSPLCTMMVVLSVMSSLLHLANADGPLGPGLPHFHQLLA